MVPRVNSHLVCMFLFTYLQSLFIPENLWTSECQIEELEEGEEAALYYGRIIRGTEGKGKQKEKGSPRLNVRQDVMSFLGSLPPQTRCQSEPPRSFPSDFHPGPRAATTTLRKPQDSLAIFPWNLSGKGWYKDSTPDHLGGVDYCASRKPREWYLKPVGRTVRGEAWNREAKQHRFFWTSSKGSVLFWLEEHKPLLATSHDSE